jgi:pyruvate/2-oxoglutarate dehydrogenase complex dihydrolipoamide dehydrogenase (E3) component
MRVVLVEARDRLLEFADAEIIEALQSQMPSAAVLLPLVERVAALVGRPEAAREQDGSESL